jgi:acetyl/propionyl-CoA carboxylase alpha subunit
MPCTRLLIANRGEIAIRIMRSAAELGIATVAVFSEDDATALHRLHGDDARALRGVGPAAYLDGGQLIALARAAGCDALHPGYGFLSEQAEFAARCAAAGLTFVGPSPAALALLGDKTRARALAASADIPTLAGSAGPVTIEKARAFLAGLGDSPDGHQSRRGWRRPRHARRPCITRADGRVRALPLRGGGRLRR